MNFINKLQFKDVYCSLNGAPGEPVPHKYINLYVKIADTCQSNCKFCEYHNCESNYQFDIIKFFDIINYFIANNVKITKVSFSGGEPTTNMVMLKRCIEFLNNLIEPPFIVVNTNGFRLNQLNAIDGIGSIALSRHAISDYDQCDIMQCHHSQIPTASQIHAIASDKIHLTCNLIRGNIDSVSEIVNYLEFCQSLNIYDVGFVSLMPANEYCVEHFIDFDSIQFDSISDKLISVKEWAFGSICRCKNFIYLPKNGKRLVKFYMRYRCKCTSPMPSNFIYDGNNLRVNFNSEVIF